ncbi:MAG TPA: RNA polymerase sigma factor [Candidatus Kapabacteria bacterium]|nr:RNA polymerase sigma factor [Candidatus Kapabacteria bacterium]
MASEADGITSDDAALFGRFLDGENEAFVSLFRKYNQRLFVYCVKIVGDAQLAQDMTQEMWERVIGMRESPQQVRNPGGLFLRIARNLCIDHIRKQRPMVPLEDVGNIEMVMDARSAPSELEELALAMLDRLQFEYREVLILNLYCGYRFDEIAAMTGKTPDAIWARASRARAHLRKLVAAAIDAPPPSQPLAGKRPSRSRTEDP